MVNTDLWTKADDLVILVFLLCLPILTLKQEYSRAILLHCQSQLKRNWKSFCGGLFVCQLYRSPCVKKEKEKKM